MAPLFTGSKLGFGRVDAAAGAAGGGIEISNEYLYLPFNETSSSRTKFGNYATSVSINSGGQAEAIHPYAITDNTYNSGNARAHRCNGESDTAYLSANTKLGGVGTGNICYDMWYNWRGTGNGGGSYGYVGDYAGANLYYPGRSGLDPNNYLAFGGINVDVIGGFRYAGGSQNLFNSSFTTSSNLDTWYHALVIRQSNKWYTFVNGVLDSYYDEGTPANISNGGGFHFGTLDRSGHWWNCNISDFMWQKGSDAFYSIDSSVGSGNIGTTYFTTPKYKNKIMAIPSNSNFSIVKAPTGFTTQ